MSDTVNPWQSPGAEVSAEKGAVSSQALSATMVRYLKEASPWLRFTGIFCFVVCGLMAVGGIFGVIFMPVSVDIAGAFGEAFGISGGMGLLYVVLGALMFFPGRFIYNFGAKIRDFTLSNAEQDLEEAFKNNKSLWKFSGILGIVSLVLIPVGMIAVVVIATSRVL
jgi:hypothetical protein